ncbi:hypothetical protein TBR22_A34590 [Luteitalea sp. TBR-22]|uniref:hypothetical protein n=1 Tax=Luteitalea sp. TBR-22 TaxID=2802971 RepID=UPI001AF051D3|nr:hypothetical protein [Luteitalea sp. TBR-22]BCS34230.1 hypothetical protein TBR22_A34590 [Luteitalea sp. TBR-22]
MGLVLLLLIVMQAAPPRHDEALSRLTAPRTALGPSCVLAPAPSERLGGDRVRSGFWGPVILPSNPWVGEDRDRVIAIGEVVVGPEEAPRLPDGPPLDRGQLQAMRAQRFEGARAYAAAYRSSDELTFVYALQWPRLEAGPRGDFAVGRATAPSSSDVYRRKGLWVRVWGSRGDCHEALRRHVEQTIDDAAVP